MCVCVCVCIYICIYIYTYVYIYNMYVSVRQSDLTRRNRRGTDALTGVTRTKNSDFPIFFTTSYHTTHPAKAGR